ncbi:YceI family protein [Mucilaginibacter terrae]|uniref:YceI family protein n=1 Tax=Mucilaginibacter terrae TaxID=1955052 RepID=UPI00363ABB59
MKTSYTIVILFMLAANSLFAQKKLNIDTKNSIVKWTGHAEIGKYAPTGTLHFKDGEARIDQGGIKNAKFTIDMKSMKTENAQLLGHLTGEDFFDVQKFPVSTIVIDRIVNGEAIGKLTIRKKELPFHCAVTVQHNNGKYTVSGDVIIDRTAYGIIYNSGNFFSGLGDKAIRNTFDISFTIYLN